MYKLILLIDIVSLFVEKSHRSPSDLETRIAHRPKDTVTLGFVGHKSNLTGRERLAPQSKNLFSDCEKEKNWFSAISTNCPDRSGFSFFFPAIFHNLRVAAA